MYDSLQENIQLLLKHVTWFSQEYTIVGSEAFFEFCLAPQNEGNLFQNGLLFCFCAI